jgi:uncharacterized protein YdeI (YjbR/CyaY-like superfamily)
MTDDRFAWIEVTSRRQLREWLLAHHEQPDAVWLVTWKKADPERWVNRDAVLDELVAFGWCDGLMRRVDDDRVRQLVSPRRTKPWARSYTMRAEQLIADGLMHASGLAAVDTAKATGQWDALADVEALVVPADLRSALEHRAPASFEFDAFPPATRRNILRWIAHAKTEPTRTKRITATAVQAQQGQRVRSNG